MIPKKDLLWSLREEVQPTVNPKRFRALDSRPMNPTPGDRSKTGTPKNCQPQQLETLQTLQAL